MRLNRPPRVMYDSRCWQDAMILARGKGLFLRGPGPLLGGPDRLLGGTGLWPVCAGETPTPRTPQALA